MFSVTVHQTLSSESDKAKKRAISDTIIFFTGDMHI